MSQHDMDIANASGSAVRADINLALLALASQNSGATAPSTTFAYQWWADTTAGILKQRNAANSAWVSILNLATGVPTGAAASGANADITSLAALTAGGLPDNSVLTSDIADAQVTPAKLSQPLTFDSPVTCAGQTNIDFNIPSWARKITVMLFGVSTATASNIIVQLGTSGSFETTGYDGGSWQANTTITSYSTGFMLGNSTVAGAQQHEVLTILAIDPSTYKFVAYGTGAVATAGGGNAHIQAGTKTLSGALTRLRVTTVAATTFDTTPGAGVVNVMYE
jgi:hypothetical protein